MTSGTSFQITGYCKISPGLVYRNGEVVFQSHSQSTDISETAAEAYRALKINYPKFFKMDRLCRVSYLAAKLLLDRRNLPLLYNPYNVGVFLSNTSSSIASDLPFYGTIRDAGNFFPSPAVFTYTLSNISLGEICISSGIKGENCFFHHAADDYGFFPSAAADILHAETSACIMGSIEYFPPEVKTVFPEKHSRNHAVLVTIEKKPETRSGEDFPAFTAEEYKKIYA